MKCPEGYSIQARTEASEVVCTSPATHPTLQWRALAMFGAAGREVTLACESLVKVVKETSVYHGGEWFCSDIETSLPYIETITPYNGCENVFMDEHYMLVERRTEVSHVHGY